MAVFTSIDSVAAHLAGIPSSTRLIVGLTGAPGSGKSTIAAALVDLVPGSVLVPMDGYHLPQRRLRELGRRDRMGAPDTFDVGAFVALLEQLRDPAESGAVVASGFDRAREEPVPEAILIPPDTRCVITEGNYLLHAEGDWARVRDLLDVSFLVELDEPRRHERLIERHVRFGKSVEAARAWALGPDESNARLIARDSELADHRIALP